MSGNKCMQTGFYAMRCGLLYFLNYRIRIDNKKHGSRINVQSIRSCDIIKRCTVESNIYDRVLKSYWLKPVAKF